MAHMYPTPLPEYILEDPKRDAERRVYHSLSLSLDNHWHVFYGVKWLLKERKRALDGETDFLIVHPQQGALCLEVKGGKISYDGKRGEWTSTDALGEIYPLKKSPIDQLRNAKYSLRQKISEQAWGKKWNTNICYALAFPHSTEAPSHMGLDIPKEIIALRSDLKEFDNKILSIFDYFKKTDDPPSPIGNDLVEQLKGFIAPVWETRCPLQYYVSAMEKEIVKITEDQFRILDQLNSFRRLAFKGGAGTGKTFLALEKAKRLGKEGFHVLLVCHTRTLSHYLNRCLGDAHGMDIDIYTYYELCATFAVEAGLSHYTSEMPGGSREDIDRIHPETLLRALDKVPHRYDAIIVDEGQDFPDSWWDPLLLCLKDTEEGLFYVFYDDNQKLFHRNEIKLSIPISNIPLRENFRNTGNIHGVASKFYEGDEIRPRLPRGQDVRIVPLDSKEQTVEKLLYTLKGLLAEDEGEESIHPNDIAVLTPLPVKSSRVMEYIRGYRPKTSDPLGIDIKNVLYDSISRFKGLERSVVIVVELEDMADEEAESMLYVGLSRARTLLFILATKDTLDKYDLSQQPEST